MSVRAPIIFVIPHDLETILAVQIPALVPQGTLHPPIRPKQKAEHEFLPRGLEYLAWSKHIPLSRWVPPEQQSGFGLFVSHRDLFESVQRIIKLPPPGQPMEPVTIAAQRASRFGDEPGPMIVCQTPASESTSGGYVALEATIPKRTRKMRAQTDKLQLILRAYPYNSPVGNFADPSSRTITIPELDGQRWAEEGMIDVTALPTGFLMLHRTNETFSSVAIVQLD